MARGVDAHRHGALFISALFALQARRERAADSVGQTLATVAGRQEPVAHPTTGRAITAYVTGNGKRYVENINCIPSFINEKKTQRILH